MLDKLHSENHSTYEENGVGGTNIQKLNQEHIGKRRKR
jgi:hypothetical protein